jgi:hypothetical protein
MVAYGILSQTVINHKKAVNIKIVGARLQYSQNSYWPITSLQKSAANYDCPFPFSSPSSPSSTNAL